MSDGHYLTGLRIAHAFVLSNLEIQISEPGELRHLILTGPNGSGKSSVLNGLQRSLSRGPREYQNWEKSLQELERELEQLEREDQPETAARRHQLQQHRSSTPWVIPRGLPVDHNPTEHVLAFLGPRRNFSPAPVSGPNNVQLTATPGSLISQSFLQYMVNKRFEQFLVRETGDEQGADRISAWFSATTSALRKLFDDPALTLALDQKTFIYSLVLAGEHKVTIEQLPDGLRSVLEIWAEIQMRVDLLELELSAPPTGFVLIDEVELHLHAELQERLLPFLTELFPRLQFIVTTHSPAVASSIPNATVYDLRTREAASSDDLRGQRYGDLFMDWFGISTDFDLQTSADLERLRDLAAQEPSRDSEAGQELAALAARLAKRSHLLGLQVWRELERPND